MYRLYAVVVHIGNMLGGHYVAYTALPTPDSDISSPDTSIAGTPTSSLDQLHGPKSDTTDKSIPRKWAYISDTVVRLATLEEVLKAKAYICMYERI
jgi:ubiquitin C-terminal hydrolase